MRRKFLQASSLLGAGLVLNQPASAQHEGHQMPGQKPKADSPKTDKPTTPPAHDHAKMMAEQAKAATGQYVPVQTPDLPKLEYTLDNGVKVFNLRAEVVHCEIMPKTHMGPARKMWAWGYNGSVPGPMIEVVEGDRVRIIFENKLPEATTVHWHGLEIPIEMDGTPYISQPMVEPGGVFIYEFTVNQNGTYFYHSHGAMQEMLGMIGMFVIHPKTPHEPRCDKDFAMILQGWALLPNNDVPNTFSMEFNWLTLNGKSAPATTPLLVKKGERVRIRIVNLGMDHHPIHLHGMQFYVTGTEGGRVPESAWFPGNTVIVGVAQARDVEFVAQYEGDWMLHCHLPHHMMNQMVSMVGPMAMSHGSGSDTGLSMENGMGMLTKGHALSEDFGPGFGRGMAMTTAEQSASHAVGQKAALPVPLTTQGGLYSCPMHPEVKSDKEGKCPKCQMTLVKQQAQEIFSCPMHPEVVSNKAGSCPKCKMTLVKKQRTAVVLSEEDKKKVPGYPQDDMMMMIVDDEVAKPETWGLAPGWTASMMGMMNLVRVLPEDKYDKIMAMVKSGQKAPAADHSHHQAEIPADAIKVTVSKDGYTPAKLTVKAGQPVKLAFTRTDEENCGGTVVFPKLKISAKLPVGQTVLVELPAQEKGELSFACGMNMLKGTLIVE
ncbi:MAG TPA: multicopper oxidase domain-containing protein [Blastocatellia bacterium]|nr:multicopper oxidase domain-containing protein [Blastocatellia bacterium]HNG31426.1 multicopper oxidase domain-containing protein [Blastocatellia bacterium]